MRRVYIYIALLGCILVAGSSAQETKDSLDRDYGGELPRIAPTEPKDVLDTFQIHPEFRIELVAAEPLVRDPIAMAFDEQGRLFVIEMRGYSEGRDDQLGTVRLLTDTDSDGVFDTSSIYATGLEWPTAIACYNGGVFVGASPEILFFKDDDGDGRADTKEVVYTGFKLTNVQGLLNTFKWGLDNRIHGATSSSGGAVQRTNYASAPVVQLSGRDFAFDPATKQMTPTSGGAQHGLTFDEYGRKFVCHNSDHIMQIMYEDAYIARNPFLPAPSPRLSIASDGPQADVFRISPVEPWRIVRTRLRVQGIVPGPVERGGKDSGYFTSATGVTVYKGDAWPDQYKGQVFVGDVGGNLVHRKTLTREGVTLRADRADTGREFLASTDIWFRPAQFCNGPDGNLYVADMYREVIEHPASLPPIIKQHLDLNSGSDRGRIYRIVPVDHKQRKLEDLGALKSKDLIPYLGHKNAWHRETAARLIYEAQELNLRAPLEAFYQQTENPTGKMQTLYTLNGLSELSEAILTEALTDPHAQVRKHALRLTESFDSPSTALQEKIMALSTDPDPEVRFQLAFSLGAWDFPRKNETLIQLAKSDAADPWIRLGLLSSIGDQSTAVAVRLLIEDTYRPGTEAAEFLLSLAFDIGARGIEANVESFLAAEEKTPDQTGKRARTLVTELLDGGRSGGTGPSVRAAVERSPRALGEIESRVRYARSTINRSEASERERIALIGDLVFASYEAVGRTLWEAIAQPRLDAVALKALATYSDSAVGVDIIRRWSSIGPSLKNAALDLLVAREDRAEALLRAIRSGKFPRDDLTSTHRHRLETHANEYIRRLSNEVLMNDYDQELEKTRQHFLTAFTLDGVKARGRAIFIDRCSTCHVLSGLGNAVGPELIDLDRDYLKLLANIIDPNGDINPQYRALNVEIRDGRFLTGVVDSETATSITLKQSGGLTETILRTQIEFIEESTISLMPEDLLDGLELQEVADLIAFILDWE